MLRTSRATHPAPRRRESKTGCARGAQPRKGWQKFRRRRCRPSRSSLRQTAQADVAVYSVLSFWTEPNFVGRLFQTPGVSQKRPTRIVLRFARNDTLEKSQSDDCFHLSV